MNLATIMKENDISLECLFTLSKLNDKEGLMFFEPIIDTVNNTEVTNLDPKCFYIDGGKIIYDESMDSNITINSVENVITFTRIDGIQLNINIDKITGFPFKTKQFKNKQIEAEIPEGFVEVK